MIAGVKLMVSSALVHVRLSGTGVLALEAYVTLAMTLSASILLHCVGTAPSGGSTTSPVMTILMGCGLK